MQFKMTKEWLLEKLRQLEEAGVEEYCEVGLPRPDVGLRAVVAKMACNSVETTKYSETYTQHKVKLGAVCGNSGENKAFTDYTPSGECWMQIADGAPALSFFKPSKKYYVTFEDAPD